jgi:serine/threonine protein kinase
MADKAFSLSAYTSSSPGAAGGVVTGVAADACAGSNSSRARRRASKRAASVSAYKDSTAFLKNELERILEYLEDKQPGVAQQLELLEDLLCRMLVVDPEQRPAAGDLLDHPFFELGRVGRQLHTAG